MKLSDQQSEEKKMDDIENDQLKQYLSKADELKREINMATNQLVDLQAQVTQLKVRKMMADKKTDEEIGNEIASAEQRLTSMLDETKAKVATAQKELEDAKSGE